MDLGGSAIGCLVIVADRSSVSVANMDIVGVISGSEDENCCVGIVEEEIVGVNAGVDTGRALHNSFKEEKF